MARKKPSHASADSQLQGELVEHSKHSYSNKHLPGSTPSTPSRGTHGKKHTDTPARTKKKKTDKKPKFVFSQSGFRRLVREIGQNVSVRSEVRFRADAVEALQEVAEDFVVKEFTMLNQIAVFTDRKTIKARDMELVKKLKAIMEGKEMSNTEDEGGTAK